MEKPPPNFFVVLGQQIDLLSHVRYRMVGRPGPPGGPLIQNTKAGVQFLNGPRRREAACSHYAFGRRKQRSQYRKISPTALDCRPGANSICYGSRESAKSR